MREIAKYNLHLNLASAEQLGIVFFDGMIHPSIRRYLCLKVGPERRLCLYTGDFLRDAGSFSLYFSQWRVVQRLPLPMTALLPWRIPGPSFEIATYLSNLISARPVEAFIKRHSRANCKGNSKRNPQRYPSSSQWRFCRPSANSYPCLVKKIRPIAERLVS